MKQTLIAIALATMTASAFATGGGDVTSTITANSGTSTFAFARNGGTSHSTATNFAMGSTVTSAVTGNGSLTVNAANCDIPGATATVNGQLTTVTGTATTMGGSTASNTSTGDAGGNAVGAGSSFAYVENERNNVSGWAASNTGTIATAGMDQTRSSFASQSASFTAKGATGSMTVATPSTTVTTHVPGQWNGWHYTPAHNVTTTVPGQTLATGFGAVSTGSSDVSASVQMFSLDNGSCGDNGCDNGPGVYNNGGTGSSTTGEAFTQTNVTYTNAPQ